MMKDFGKLILSSLISFLLTAIFITVSLFIPWRGVISPFLVAIFIFSVGMYFNVYLSRGSGFYWRLGSIVIYVIAVSISLSKSHLFNAPSGMSM